MVVIGLHAKENHDKRKGEYIKKHDIYKSYIENVILLIALKYF